MKEIRRLLVAADLTETVRSALVAAEQVMALDLSRRQQSDPTLKRRRRGAPIVLLDQEITGDHCHDDEEAKSPVVALRGCVRVCLTIDDVQPGGNEPERLARLWDLSQASRGARVTHRQQLRIASSEAEERNGRRVRVGRQFPVAFVFEESGVRDESRGASVQLSVREPADRIDER